MTLWANLLHLGFNLWEDVSYGPDWAPPSHDGMRPSWRRTWSDTLQCDDATWADLTERMAQAGFNCVVMDLAEGIRYDSHPEIGVRGSWSTERLRDELTRLRQLGLEPVPKLNFSTAHDAWLGAYHRQVSTPRYYDVCAELIAEVCELFDRPRFFHLGMDEETAFFQRFQHFAVVRQHDLWWHDLNFYADTVTACGSRPWVWSDYAWNHPDFYERMPKNIVQSNWYYGEVFGGLSETDRPRVLADDQHYLAYLDLADHGYDQIPTGSVVKSSSNFAHTMEFANQRLPSEKMLGFLQTPWAATVPESRERHDAAISEVEAVIRSLDPG